jgi:hypothetical protein|tara:strand:- start:9927 stop:10511 length:585 start_codon:yes stop_codon:yes gene_type:complete
MPVTELNGRDALTGRVRAYEVPQPYADAVWERQTDWSSNDVVYEWATIVGNLLNGTGLNYRIGGMYLEFDNGAGPIAAPTFDRTRSVDYYNNLIGTRDYLRVPLTAATLTSSDASLFPSGNKCTFFSRSTGIAGVHGRAFGTGSIIFGASLVAYVDSTDATQDLILSSMYFGASDQQDKLSTSQIGLEWELTLQ